MHTWSHYRWISLGVLTHLESRLPFWSASKRLFSISSVPGPGASMISLGCYEVTLCGVNRLNGASERTAGSNSKLIHELVDCLCSMCPIPWAQRLFRSQCPSQAMFSPWRWQTERKTTSFCLKSLGFTSAKNPVGQSKSLIHSWCHRDFVSPSRGMNIKNWEWGHWFNLNLSINWSIIYL